MSRGHRFHRLGGFFAALSALSPTAALAADFKLLSFTTLLGEIITFAILVWVVMKYVWPPLMGAVEERQKEIADGLAAGEQGRQDLAAANTRKDELLADARAKAGASIADGERRKGEIVDSARAEADSEKAKILEQGRKELELERAAMHRETEQKVGALVIDGASQILGREVDAAAHADIVAALQKRMQS